jgi:hypothetical protein
MPGATRQVFTPLTNLGRDDSCLVPPARTRTGTVSARAFARPVKAVTMSAMSSIFR